MSKKKVRKSSLPAWPPSYSLKMLNKLVNSRPDVWYGVRTLCALMYITRGEGVYYKYKFDFEISKWCTTAHCTYHIVIGRKVSLFTIQQRLGEQDTWQSSTSSETSFLADMRNRWSRFIFKLWRVNTCCDGNSNKRRIEEKRRERDLLRSHGNV